MPYIEKAGFLHRSVPLKRFEWISLHILRVDLTAQMSLTERLPATRLNRM